jgi:hypothetical protein
MNAAGERPPGVDVILGKPLSRRPLIEVVELVGRRAVEGTVL